MLSDPQLTSIDELYKQSPVITLFRCDSKQPSGLVSLLSAERTVKLLQFERRYTKSAQAAIGLENDEDDFEPLCINQENVTSQSRVYETIRELYSKEPSCKNLEEVLHHIILIHSNPLIDFVEQFTKENEQILTALIL